jgi:hypothetical protein
MAPLAADSLSPAGASQGRRAAFLIALRCVRSDGRWGSFEGLALSAVVRKIIEHDAAPSAWIEILEETGRSVER